MISLRRALEIPGSRSAVHRALADMVEMALVDLAGLAGAPSRFRARSIASTAVYSRAHRQS